MTQYVPIDSKTEVSAVNSGAEFRFTNIADSSMLLRPSPLSTQVSFSESPEKYAKAARELLPAGAESITAETQTANPFPINDWSSYTFLFSYELGGFPWRMCIVFLNLNPNEQIVVETYSHQKTGISRPLAPGTRFAAGMK